MDIERFGVGVCRLRIPLLDFVKGVELDFQMSELSEIQLIASDVYFCLQNCTPSVPINKPWEKANLCMPKIKCLECLYFIF